LILEQLFNTECMITPWQAAGEASSICAGAHRQPTLIQYLRVLLQARWVFRVELEAAAVARRVREEVPRQLSDESRKLTHAEHDDDDNQHQRDVVVVLLTGALHLSPLLVDVLERRHQPHVEHGERRQRNDEHKHRVERPSIVA